MPFQIFQPSLRRGSIRFEKLIFFVFLHIIISAFVRSRPAHHPALLLSVCSSTHSARCSVRFRSAGPASISFPHNAFLWQHYANHSPKSLIRSFLQFHTSTSAKYRQYFSCLVAAWIIHLQSLTANQRLATVLPCRSPAPLAFQPTSGPFRTTSTSNSVTITPALSRWTLST